MRRRRSLVAVATAVTLLTSLFVAPPLHAAPAPPPVEPAKPGMSAQSAPVTPPRVSDKVDPGPDGAPAVGKEPSKAQPIAALPEVNPGPDGHVPVDRQPIAPNPPVRPAPLDLATRPGRELVDATATDALAALGRAGRLTPDGKPSLDATALQPQVGSAQFIDPTRKASLQELRDALTSGNIPPPLPVDPLALLQQLPDGIPRITYRICSESRTKAVSCTNTLPLAVPAIVDVTGDHTPDVLADLVPAAGVGDIVDVSRKILDLQRLLGEKNTRLAQVDEALADPEHDNREQLEQERAELIDLIGTLKRLLVERTQDLLNLVHLGLGLVSLRLPTSEFAGADLPAHVWAVYDIPTRKRLSVGFDGFRRGAGLSTAAIGVYTFNPATLINGIYDIKASVVQVGAAESVAITAGFANVTDNAEGKAYEPTVASARFSPVPTLFTAHAKIDPGAADRAQTAVVDATTNVRTQLDTQVLSNGATESRFDRVKVDKVPNLVSASLTRPPGGAESALDYSASAVIDDVEFADLVYQGATLDKATLAGAKSVPDRFKAALTSGNDQVKLDYQASARLGELTVAMFDRDPSIVLRGALRDLPSQLVIDTDLPGRHVVFRGNEALGSAEVGLSRDLGGWAPLPGDHATLVLSGRKVGVSARVTGLKTIDVFFGDHPRGTTEFTPGGQAFSGAGNVDGHLKGRLDVSNLPATLSFDLNNAQRTVAFRASSVVDRVKAAFVDTTTGPSAVAAVNKVPRSVDVKYDLGDRPRATYKASSPVPLVELFVSPQGVEQLDPNAHHYLSAAVTDIPAEADLLVDLPARHLEGRMSAPVGGITAVARSPFAGRDFVAIAELQGVPAHLDADFGNGTFRFRGISGPLGMARFSVTNHAGATAPAGQHVSAHYKETSGDFDGSVLVRNLSHAEYSRTDAEQTTRLDSDTLGQPVFADADVVLAANGRDDTRLALTAKITNLPKTLVLKQNLADGKLTYTGDKSIGLQAEVRLGKIKALDGLGAPMFANGAAVRARGCDEGAGCVKVDTPICKLFPRCLGVVGTVNLPSLPTNLALNLAQKQIEFTGYTQPAGAPLKAYLEVDGLLANLPRIEGLVSLDGLPGNLDLTVGPINVDGNPARVDVGYTASAPLGTLQVDAEAATSTAFGVLRGRASVAKLPAKLKVTGTFDAVTKLGVHNSAPIDEITAALSDVHGGFLSASARGIPADLDVTVDAPAKHFESKASSAFGGITFAAARVPFAGREYRAFAQATNLPAQMTADWTDGKLRFAGNGAVGAKFAVTNHDGATAPVGQHVAAHYRQSTGDLDASAAVTALSAIAVDQKANGLTFDMRSGDGTFAFDGDFVFGDTRYAGFGRVSLPSHLDVSYGDGKLHYGTDRPVGIEAEAKIGKIAVIDQVGAVPFYPHGVALEAKGCDGGNGCGRDTTPICSLLGKCFGAVSTVNLPGLPTSVDVDMATKKVDILGYRAPAGVDLTAYVRLDDLFDGMPHLAGKAALAGLPAPFDLHLGPFGFQGNDIGAQYTSSAPLEVLAVHAEADTTAFGPLTGELAVYGVPARMKIGAKFGKDTVARIEASSPITRVEANVTGRFNDKTASARLAVTNIAACGPEQCVDIRMEGTDSNGTPVKVPMVTIDSPVPGLGVEAFVQGYVHIDVHPIYLQLHDAYFKIVDAGRFVRTVITETAPGSGLMQTRFQSTPAAGRLIVGGAISLQTDEIPIPDPAVGIRPWCDVAVATVHVRGHARVYLLEIGTAYLHAEGFTDMSLVPGMSYLAFGFKGDYSKVGFTVDDVRLNIDLDIEVKVVKFDDPDYPPLYENRIRLAPNETRRGLNFHVFDQQYGGTASLRLNVRPPFDIRVYDFPRVPRLLETVPPNGTTSGFVYLPDNPADRRVVFNMLDPGLASPEQALVDLATAFAFAPFEKNGGPGSGGCEEG